MNPFAASGGWRKLSRAEAVALCKKHDLANWIIRKNLHGRGLPRLGHEVGLMIDGVTYWLANEGGSYYFKHPEYEKERA